MHIEDIAAKAGVDSMKLGRMILRKDMRSSTHELLIGRLLRVLCNHNVYREVTPDVFANTRISSVLDTGKSVEELLDKLRAPTT